jgi:hypothetical protein
MVKTTDPDSVPVSQWTPLVNGVKAIGEMTVLPGASLLIDGDVKSGTLHAVGGVVALMALGPVLGPIGWLAMAADSFSQSVSGRHIYEHFRKSDVD